MSFHSNTATGPKSAAGKAIASKNAQKAGIFSKGYLPWEDLALKQREFESLIEEWGVHGPTGILFLRDIEQANLAQERLMHAERLMIEGIMQSLEIAEEFVERARIDSVGPEDLPSWFFLDDDGGNKKVSHYFDQVYEQAADLKEKYSDQLVAHSQERYPQLYDYVMADSDSKASFVMALAQAYKQSAPTLNLAALMNELCEKYRFQLLWAIDPPRFQAIINGLRAEKILEVLDFDKSNRYLTSFQNRKIRAIQGLVGLEQRAQHKYLSNRVTQASGIDADLSINDKSS